MAALLINNSGIVVVAILPLTTHPTSWAELHVGTLQHTPPQCHLGQSYM